MTIRRESLESGQIDLSDVTDGARFAPVHGRRAEARVPETARPVGLWLGRRAWRVAFPHQCNRSGAPGGDETALRLGRFFGTSADFWLGLQAAYDLEVARPALGEKIKAEVRPRAA